MEQFVPARAKYILDFIGRHEAPKGFDQVYGGIKRADLPPMPLTEMTVQEVLDWQDSIDPKYPSEAAGRFQIMEDTLRGLVDQGIVSAALVFTEHTQYRIAFELMRRRGYDRFVKGEKNLIKFGNSLAAEWASLPMLSGPKKGRSRYDGDGLNSALTTVEEFTRVLNYDPEKVMVNLVPRPLGPNPDEIYAVERHMNLARDALDEMAKILARVRD